MIQLALTIVLAQPLGFSMVPRLDLDLPPAPKPVECAEDMTTFLPRPTPLVGDFTIKYIKDNKPKTWILKPGFLYSECEHLRVINTMLERNRLKKEVAAYEKLRTKEHAHWANGELAYQREILRNREGSFWEDWDAPIMFGLGMLTIAVPILISVIVINKLEVEK
jgi:hypothetical protein